MRIIVQDKYFLRDLHREIDLFDRKLIHLSKYEMFATEALREAAVKKMTTKRDSLAETARTLAASGIEFQTSELPRSFRPADAAIDEETPASEPDTERSSRPVSPVSEGKSQSRMIPSHFGEQIARLQKQVDPSPLASWQNDLVAYKRRRQKPHAAEPVAS